MIHPLVLGLFETPAAAAAAARELRALGVPRDRVSIVARNHDEEGELAKASGASPGSEIEDSRIAARLGELSAHLFAAIAVVLPGIGSIVADGPLASGLAEAAGHWAGGVARTLESAGVPDGIAADWANSIDAGSVLIGAHVTPGSEGDAETALRQAGASKVMTGVWPG